MYYEHIEMNKKKQKLKMNEEGMIKKRAKCKDLTF
jgi:hypothetical protein